MGTLAEMGASRTDQGMPAAVPAQVEEAVRRARDYLLGLQHPAGYWVGELEADASVSAGYIALMYYMFGKVDPVRERKVIAFARSKQNPDGSWPSYFGGSGDLSVTVQVYFALKLAGIAADEPFMQRARQFVLSRGGVCKVNVITKIWLALFGQYDWRGTPTVPPEVILLPNWFYFNIYEFASWSRETIMALTIVLTQKPTCAVPETAPIDELYVEPVGQRDYSLGKVDRLFSWRTFFLGADALFKLWEKLPLKPARRTALRRTEQWIVEHQEADGSWGGIMLPWVYSLIALKALGYPMDHPVMVKGMAGLEGFIVEDEASMRLLPATSPVWDTAWAILSLAESGLAPDYEALVSAARWLLGQEIKVGGDWQVKNPATPPGGWAFEFHNDFYPDLDDGAVVPRALRRIRLQETEDRGKEEAVGRSTNWVVSMQSKDGGWSAFDKDNDRTFLTHVPFADFMSPLDPTCSDVTAHAVELLAEGQTHPDAMARAVAYLKKTQQPDGSWYGRWGVNYLYGTGLVLAALGAAGEEPHQGYVRKAASWLLSHQNHDGGWGESCHSYEDPSTRGKGTSSASQTAWAVLGLISVREHESEAVQKGIAYLLRTQQYDGSWLEEEYTGTGFPRAFYLRYDLYRIYFPLLALAKYLTHRKGASRR